MDTPFEITARCCEHDLAPPHMNPCYQIEAAALSDPGRLAEATRMLARSCTSTARAATCEHYLVLTKGKAGAPAPAALVDTFGPLCAAGQGDSGACQLLLRWTQPEHGAAWHRAIAPLCERTLASLGDYRWPCVSLAKAERSGQYVPAPGHRLADALYRLQAEACAQGTREACSAAQELAVDPGEQRRLGAEMLRRDRAQCLTGDAAACERAVDRLGADPDALRAWMVLCEKRQGEQQRLDACGRVFAAKPEQAATLCRLGLPAACERLACDGGAAAERTLAAICGKPPGVEKKDWSWSGWSDREPSASDPWFACLWSAARAPTKAPRRLLGYLFFAPFPCCARQTKAVTDAVRTDRDRVYTTIIESSRRTIEDRYRRAAEPVRARCEGGDYRAREVDVQSGRWVDVTRASGCSQDQRERQRNELDALRASAEKELAALEETVSQFLARALHRHARCPASRKP